MRRGSPRPELRADTNLAGPWARIERGPRGLRLVEDAAPEDGVLAPGGPLRVERAVPVPAHEVAITNAGRMALTAWPGVARSLRLPDLLPQFDRRPAGLSRVAGAAVANAGLLLADDGWRAVVLPSLGDLAADLGPGPVALRADGRRLAVARDDGVDEMDLPGARPAGRHEGRVDALCYDLEGGLVVAAGAAVGRPGTPPTDGSPIVALTAAAGVPRALARHADGSLSTWDPVAGVRLASWPAPLSGPLCIALSPDGEWAALGTPFATPHAVAVVRTADGALVRRIADARAIAFGPDEDGLTIAGEWGTALLAPPADPGTVI